MDRDKILDLISNKIFSTTLKSDLSPPSRLRFIRTMLEIWADAVLKDELETMTKKQ